MSRGSYNGGSTIAGRWSDTRDFPTFKRPDPSSAPKSKYWPKSTKAERRLAREAAVAAKAAKLGLTCKEALVQAGRPPLPTKPKARSAALKALVAEGFLLPTGLPNPEHPQVRPWIKMIEKSKA